MKKIILSLALIIVVAIATGVYYVLGNLNSPVEAAIEKYASQVMQGVC